MRNAAVLTKAVAEALLLVALGFDLDPDFGGSVIA